MDPISIIVIALATGAAAGLKPTTENIIKEAYESIKSLISSRYGSEEINSLEKDPASKNRQGVLKDELQKLEADKDRELLRQAQELLDAVKEHNPNVATAVGFSVDELKAASLKLKDISVHGRGSAAVKGGKWDIGGTVDVENIQVESGETDPKA